MVLMARRQAEVLEELEEWREDVRERGIGSRVVLLAVPTEWGRSAVLAQFRDSVDEADGPVTMVAGIDGNLAGGRAVQAAALREVLAGIAPPSRAAELLDLDTPAGKAGLGLEVGAWFVPGLAVAVSVTVLSRLLGAAGRVRDDGPGLREVFRRVLRRETPVTDLSGRRLINDRYLRRCSGFLLLLGFHSPLLAAAWRTRSGPSSRGRTRRQCDRQTELDRR